LKSFPEFRCEYNFDFFTASPKYSIFAERYKIVFCSVKKTLAVIRLVPTSGFVSDPRSGHVEFMAEKLALGQVLSGCFGLSPSFHQLLHIN
jgi:hypothetical protein